jgi:hypothetical protein
MFTSGVRFEWKIPNHRVHLHNITNKFGEKKLFQVLDGDKIENIVNFPLSVAILDSGCRGNQ